MRTTNSNLWAISLIFSSCFAAGMAAADPIISLNGAGATFPYPLYSKWVFEFNKLHPNVQINYQSIGSGGGIRQISEGTVDFAGSDAFMTGEALAKLPERLLHIPTTLGAVVLTYNLAGAPADLRLTPEIISGIFLGTITKWNDSRIASLNPGWAPRDEVIQVVHRSDGSGTSAVFTGYLSAVSPEWKEKVGSGTSVSWPAGLGAKGNEGVTGQVKSTPGSIGYVELVYAKQTKLPYASIRNQSGAFVSPTLESVSAAAGSVPIPDDFRVSLVNAPGDKSYPISAFTWILLCQKHKDRPKGQALVEFLWWAVHDGQQFGPPLSYAQLPADLVKRIESKLSTVEAGGKPVLSR